MFVATGNGLGHAELFARVTRHLPDTAEVTTRTVEWGSWLVAVVPTGHGWAGTWHQRGRWLVAGWPSRDPWGHHEPMDHLDVTMDLERFGSAAMQMVAGPAVAVDLETNTWAPALNGLLAPGVELDDHRIRTTAAPRRELPVHAAPIPDSSPAFTFGGLVNEVDVRGPARGPRHPLPDATVDGLTSVLGRDWAHDVYETDRGLVLRPRNLSDALADPARLPAIRREVVPELVWRAARRGRPLAVPFLERPALDQIGFGRGQVNA